MMETFDQILKQCHKTRDYRPVVDAIPYASLIGLDYQQFGHDVIFKLPDNPNNIGNPILPAVHGGVVGGFMELSAAIHLLMMLDTPAMPKIVDFSLDYLRPVRGGKDTFVECQVIRQGSRVANVIINAWQTRREEAVATARAHFLLAP
jgi:acyl-coenzyme A thioesterase PaaI-like protein